MYEIKIETDMELEGEVNKTTIIFSPKDHKPCTPELDDTIKSEAPENLVEIPKKQMEPAKEPIMNRVPPENDHVKDCKQGTGNTRHNSDINHSAKTHPPCSTKLRPRKSIARALSQTISTDVQNDMIDNIGTPRQKKITPKKDIHQGKDTLRPAETSLKEVKTFDDSSIGLECSDCGKTFKYKKRLLHHENKHRTCHKNTKDPFICQYCGIIFGTKKGKTSHLKRKPVEKRRKCDLCGEEYDDPEEHMIRCYHNEMVNHTSSTLENNHATSTREAIISHKSEPTRVSLLCPYCGKMFPLSRQVNKHIKYVHHKIPKTKYACKICEKKVHDVPKHMRIVHSDRKPWVCEKCGKTFKIEVLLKSHIKSHTDQVVHTCEHCGKSFKFKHHLTNHLLSHSEIRKFACSDCSLTFKMAHHLRSHVKTQHTAKQTDKDN